MGAPKKPRKPRRKKVEKASKGLSATEAATGGAEGGTLAEQIKADGGSALAVYKEPLGGHTVVFAVLPIDKVEPTPYQRDRSETHLKKLAAAMERVDRYLDPIIAVRKDGKYWTPNGNHRLGALNLLGIKSITALVIPEEDTAFQILALNTEKAHNVKERSLEVIRMYRGLVGAGGGKETEYASIFEEPYFATFGAAYEKRPRYSAGAYSSVVRRLDSFLDESVEQGLKEREKRADQLLAWDDEVAAVVLALKAKGFESPYLKNYVVARVNFLRFKKDTSDLEFEATIEELRNKTKKIDPLKVNKEDIAKMGGGGGGGGDEE
jgi:ParB family transcriptional regulator, chromosome partitioning protein